MGFFSNSDFPSCINNNLFRTALFLGKLPLHTFSEWPLQRNSYFLGAAISLEQLPFYGAPLPEQSLFRRLFQNSFFFRAKLLQSKHFLRTGNYLGQLIFKTAIFLAEELLRKKTSTEELLFQSRYFATSTFSGKLTIWKS